MAALQALTTAEQSENAGQWCYKERLAAASRKNSSDLSVIQREAVIYLGLNNARFYWETEKPSQTEQEQKSGEVEREQTGAVLLLLAMKTAHLDPKRISCIFLFKCWQALPQGDASNWKEDCKASLCYTGVNTSVYARTHKQTILLPSTYFLEVYIYKESKWTDLKN